MTKGMVKITNILLQCVGIVYSDIQAVCRSSKIVTALVLKFTREQWGATALLTSYPMLNT